MPIRPSWCVIAIALAGRDVRAQVAAEVAATMNTGYLSYEQDAPSALMPAPGPTSGLFTELRPSIVFEHDSRRVIWRAGVMVGTFVPLESDPAMSYTTQGTLALAAWPSEVTSMTVVGSFGLGGEALLASERAADTGQPTIRGNGNPEVLTANATETVALQARPTWTIRQGLTGALVAPQQQLDGVNANALATLAVDHEYRRDTVGVELRAGISQVQPQLLPMMTTPFRTYTSSIGARWNHDESRTWNWQVSAGLTRMITDADSDPPAVVPTGTALLRYTADRTVASLAFTQDFTPNLIVGTVSASSQLAARGAVTLDASRRRVLAFSAGIRHDEPIGAAGVLATAAGNAVQADVGLTMSFKRNVLAVVRYSAGLELGQVGALGPQLTQIVTLGFTATYATGVVHPPPGIGERVDQTDGTLFRVVDEPAEATGDPRDTHP
jgi:hypothetical protein